MKCNVLWNVFKQCDVVIIQIVRKKKRRRKACIKPSRHVEVATMLPFSGEPT